jgi:hypothetical protein
MENYSIVQLHLLTGDENKKESEPQGQTSVQQIVYLYNKQ